MNRISSNELAKLLGELIVIVVGVLLALAADRWNQNREDQIRANSYLERLETELLSDHSRLTAELESSEASMMSGIALLDKIQSKSEIEEDTRQLYFGCIRGAPMPHAGGSTFQEMQSSGDLGLIDESLRQALFDYYGFVDSQLQRLQDMRRIGRDPITETAFRIGAWIREGEDWTLSGDELLQQFQQYPNIDEIVSSCIAFQTTTAGQLDQWIGRLLQLIEIAGNRRL